MTLSVYTYLALSLLIAFIITYFSIPTIVKVARAKSLYDVPNSRTSHTRVVPTLGGLAIFSSVIIVYSIFLDFSVKEFKYLIAALTIMFFIGVKDDILVIAPGKKLLAQLISAGLLVFLADVRFTSLHGIFGITIIPYWLSVSLSLFIIIVILNGLNLIDGIDGLASGVGALVTLTFGIWFVMADYIQFGIICFALFGSLIAFLRFNTYNGEYKIFMGDTGSLIVGLILAVVTIKFNEFNAYHTGPFKVNAAPAVSFGILVVPLFDTLRVFTIRIFNGRSPFVADKNHIHHYLLRLGFSHVESTIRILLTNSIFIIAVFCFDNIIRNEFMMVSTVAISAFLAGFLKWRYNFIVKRLRIQEIEEKKSIRLNIGYLDNKNDKDPTKKRGHIVNQGISVN